MYEDIIVAGTGKVYVPPNVLFFRKNKEYLAPTLTKTGNITRRNKKPVITIEKLNESPKTKIRVYEEGLTKKEIDKNEKVKKINKELQIINVERVKVEDKLEKLNTRTKLYRETKILLSELRSKENKLYSDKKQLLPSGSFL